MTEKDLQTLRAEIEAMVKQIKREMWAAMKPERPSLKRQ